MYCDKCGKSVYMSNSARTLQYIVEYGRLPDQNEFTTFTKSGDRHLLPTDDCQGSPSRYQYLEGMSRDPRGGVYNDDLEKKYRQAYKILKDLT